jgi:branched-subunit amino acid transport protein
MVGAAPFGVIFGALATSQAPHLSPFETMSLFAFSGSAQFVAISLMAASAPAWVIWTVTLILNLPHTLYAATLVGYVRHLPLGWRFIEKALAHCPVALLTAIIVPFALHLDQAPDGSEWFNPDLFAAIAAIAASLLTRNLLVTIAVGFGTALLRNIGLM